MEIPEGRRHRRARRGASRTLHVDGTAERTLARIVHELRSARLDAGLSQNGLAIGLPVRGRAISEWETRAVEPSMEHLVLWSRELGRRLVIVGRDGEVRLGPARPWAGEKRESFERRRLAIPLRSRRLALRLSQDELGELVGVSRDSIGRWELAHVPPRPIALIVWAQKLGYSAALWSVDGSREPVSAGARLRQPAEVRLDNPVPKVVLEPGLGN